jgi:two-component system NtrC family sensor kinase
VAPLLREGASLGAIVIRREVVQPFTDKQIALLQTFAAQAVIAIENVRLFNETKEALEQQTATSEILRVIASSPADVQPVFDAIVRSARGLFDGLSCTAWRLDGEQLHRVASNNFSPGVDEAIGAMGPIPLTRENVGARAILDRAVVHVPDIEADPEATGTRERMRMAGVRAVLMAPMLREGRAIGAIAIVRQDPVPFTPRQIELLKTFAAQAVIAIENVRLFQELQEKNRALTEAHVQVTESLEQQTATAEILRVIASSPTDLGPVMDTVAANAARLCEAADGVIFLVDGELLRPLAAYGPLGLPAPRPVNRRTVSGRAVVDRRTVHVRDVPAETAEYPDSDYKSWGHRTVISTPLLREGVPLGTISIRRTEVRPFTHRHVSLLETFADQAVIAIENVRLFKELESRNRDLTAAHAQVTESLEQQTATADILRVIASSPTDLQPVFDVMVQSAVRLCDGLHAAMFRFDGELIHFAAQHNFTPEGIEAVRRTFPVRPTRALGSGRAILSRAVVHIPDVEVDPEFAHQAMTRTHSPARSGGIGTAMPRRMHKPSRSASTTAPRAPARRTASRAASGSCAGLARTIASGDAPSGGRSIHVIPGPCASIAANAR